MARSVGNYDVSNVLKQVVENFERTRQDAPRCLTLSSYTMTANANGGQGAKREIYECLVYAFYCIDGDQESDNAGPILDFELLETASCTKYVNES